METYEANVDSTCRFKRHSRSDRTSQPSACRLRSPFNSSLVSDDRKQVLPTDFPAAAIDWRLAITSSSRFY